MLSLLVLALGAAATPSWQHLVARQGFINTLPDACKENECNVLVTAYTGCHSRDMETCMSMCQQWSEVERCFTCAVENGVTQESATSSQNSFSDMCNRGSGGNASASASGSATGESSAEAASGTSVAPSASAEATSDAEPASGSAAASGSGNSARPTASGSASPTTSERNGAAAGGATSAAPSPAASSPATSPTSAAAPGLALSGSAIVAAVFAGAFLL